ncbi:hypothetical protein OROGR_025734 [Orobanche gracilis]
MAIRFTSLLALAAIFLYLAAFPATARSLSDHQNPEAAHSGQYPAHLGTHAYSPPPTANGEEKARAPEPYPGFYELIDECLQKMPEVCGEQMFSGIIGIHDNVMTAVSDSCCEDLVKIGEECHQKILNATLIAPEISDREREDIKKRDGNIWAHCSKFAAE